MKSLRRLALLSFLAMALPGLAQSAKPEPPAEPIKIDPQRISVLSVLGDNAQLISVSAARPDTSLAGEWSSAPAGGIDGAVLQTIEQTIKASGARKDIKLYTTSTRSMFGDPAKLFVDGKLALPGQLGDAVRQSGAAHLLLVTRNRQAAGLAGTLPKLPGALGAALEGPGFVFDQRPAGQIGIDGSPGQPVLAPFVFIRVALIDLSDLKVRKEQSIAVARRLPVSREAGDNPWAALSAEQRKEALIALIDAELPKAIDALLAK